MNKTNKKLNDKALDRVLREEAGGWGAAVDRAADRLEGGAWVSFTKEGELDFAHIMTGARQRSARPGHWMNAAACFILVFFVGLGGGIITSAEADNGIILDFPFNPFAPSTEFNFSVVSDSSVSADNTLIIKEVNLKYIPRGFKLEEKKFSSSIGYVEMTDGENNFFSFSVHPNSGKKYVDTENADVIFTEINGFDAVIISKYYDDDKYTSVLWGDGSKVYFVSGNISRKKIIKIAENAKVA